MNSFWVDPSTGKITGNGGTPPPGSKVVNYNPGESKLPSPSGGNIPYGRLAMVLGGGMIGHSIASSLLDGDDEDEKKMSLWKKVLRKVLPIGAAVAGAAGGNALKDLLDKHASDNAVYRLDENLYNDYANNDKKDALSKILNLGGYGSGAGSAFFGKRWINTAKDVGSLEDAIKMQEAFKNVELARNGVSSFNTEKVLAGLHAKLNKIKDRKAFARKGALRLGGGAILALLAAKGLSARSESNKMHAAKIREALDALKKR